MRAISVKQPHAGLICAGRKRIETRTWRTKYRGWLYICSSKKPPIDPAGKALCVVQLCDVIPMESRHEEDACCKVYPGAYAWLLRLILRVRKPFDMRGKLGLFKITDEMLPKCYICRQPLPLGGLLCEGCYKTELFKKQIPHTPKGIIKMPTEEEIIANL